MARQRTCFPMGSVGRGGWGIPSQGEGEERGLPSPCLGLGKDRTNDNVRGRCRWHAEALLSLKRGLYRILFARLKKIILLRERHREKREGETQRENLHRLYIQLQQILDTFIPPPPPPR